MKARCAAATFSVLPDHAFCGVACKPGQVCAGGACGLLWEFWNYWAATKWTYTVPYLGGVKLFEMPVLGFLGFPPFAVECWAMYVFCRSLLTPRPRAGEKNWEGLWPAASE